jgi:hypothetical protein
MFTGGSGSAEAGGLGEKGREEVRTFVREGGGYVGICAGAYLACTGFEWGVGVLNARSRFAEVASRPGEVRIEGRGFRGKVACARRPLRERPHPQAGCASGSPATRP